MASGLQPKQPSVTNYDSNPAYGVVSCSQVHTESRSDVSVHDQGKQISSFTQNRFNATPNNLDDEPQDYIYPNPDPTPVPSMDPNNMIPASAPPCYQVSAVSSDGTLGITKPDYPSPHSFLALAVTVTVTCTIFNPLSLFFGIPALVLSILTLRYKYKVEDYPKAKAYGRCAFAFSVITVLFTLGCAILITASTLGAYVRSECRSLRIFRNSDPECANF